MAGAPAKFEVLLTEGVEQDLESIHDYISEVDCVANANCVLDELMEAVESLSRFPERGSYPKELVGLGINLNSSVSPLPRPKQGEAGPCAAAFWPWRR